MNITQFLRTVLGASAGRAVAFSVAALAAALMVAGPAFAAPKLNYCQWAAAKQRGDYGQCVKQEKAALKKLKGRSMSPKTKDYCDSLAETIYGRSNAIMLQCIEDIERRASGAASRGPGGKR